jgi:hypothetical protein
MAVGPRPEARVVPPLPPSRIVEGLHVLTDTRRIGIHGFLLHVTIWNPPESQLFAAQKVPTTREVVFRSPLNCYQQTDGTPLRWSTIHPRPPRYSSKNCIKVDVTRREVSQNIPPNGARPHFIVAISFKHFYKAIVNEQNKSRAMIETLDIGDHVAKMK